MKFKDFVLKEGNHFVAMEYYNLILNRTYLCLLTEDYLIGLKVNGIVGVEGGKNREFIILVSQSGRKIASWFK